MIGDILKRIRKIYGYTAVDLSSQLGISNSYLSEIENNKKKPSLDLLEAYSNILGIKVSTLILLSENLADNPSNKKTDDFIKNAMIKVINLMSKDLMNDETV